MEKDKNSPKVGDLVYCHAIGSKYAWYIDQLGIVLEIVAKPLLPSSPKNKVYKIWLMDQNRYQWVESRDFRVGNIEIIKKENGDVMYGRSFKPKKKDNQ